MADKRLFFKLNRAQHLLYIHVEQECQKLLGVTPVQLGAPDLPRALMVALDEKLGAYLEKRTEDGKRKTED